MSDEFVPVRFGGEGWVNTQPPNAIFKMQPATHRPNIKQLTRLVYRAVRMGWTPDNNAIGWYTKHYTDTRDCLPAGILRDDFQAFHHQHYAMTERIDRTAARTFPQSWKRIYNRINGIKENQS